MSTPASLECQIGHVSSSSREPREGLTGKNGAELQGGRGGALEQLDGHRAGVGRGVVPGDGVGRAGSDGLRLGGGQDGVEAGGLGLGGGDESQEGGGGDGVLHFERLLWGYCFEVGIR